MTHSKPLPRFHICLLAAGDGGATGAAAGTPYYLDEDLYKDDPSLEFDDEDDDDDDVGDDEPEAAVQLSCRCCCICALFSRFISFLNFCMKMSVDSFLESGYLFIN